ncbi:MAG: protein kinase [Phycisphaerales bacterium]
MPPSEFAIPKLTLDAQRFQLIREIFLDAQRFRGAARAAFLAQRCGGDASLQKQVTDLLRHDESDTSVLDKPLVSPLQEGAPAGAPATRPVGRFRILQLLGEGASGTTSLAQNPDAKSRRAIVKVLHSSLVPSPIVAEDVLARIRIDHRSLASLRQHPSPRLLEAGATSSGRVYVATDFVPGENILAYCERVRAPIRSRLLLFLDACEAMQSAHLCGVMHAGFTPGNAMVRMAGDVPTVMLLDFGVARALHDLLGNRRAWVEARLAHGAAEYLAPEQVAEQPKLAEPGADVYALGALLYELLVGVAPFDRFALRRAGLGDFPRIIAEQPVLEPARRFDELGDKQQELSERRASAVRDLAGELEGDLALIPMKALSKSPASRYASAGAMADDIRTYLDGKPLGGSAGLSLKVRRLFDRWRPDKSGK